MTLSASEADDGVGSVFAGTNGGSGVRRVVVETGVAVTDSERGGRGGGMGLEACGSWGDAMTGSAEDSDRGVTSECVSVAAGSFEVVRDTGCNEDSCWGCCCPLRVGLLNSLYMLWIAGAFSLVSIGCGGGVGGA